MRESIKILLGSGIVYVVLAACASARSGDSDDDGDDGFGARGAASGRGGAMGRGGNVMDALTDPVPDARADTVSGTRLRARHYVGEDGSRQFIGWHDTERNESCSFQIASDGVTRCLPTPEINGIQFSDANCTVPLFVMGPPSQGCAAPPPPRYAFAPRGCGVSDIFSLVPTAPPAGQYLKGATTCIATSAVAGATFYSGTPVPPNSFVAASEALE